MKYCVSVRQDLETLRAADEIKIDFKDIDILKEISNLYIDKTIILKIPKNFVDIPWTTISNINKINNNIIICLEDIQDYSKCINHQLKFYWEYKITSFYELNYMAECGVSYFLLGPPLYFDLKVIKNKYPNIKIRLIANKCYDDYIPQNTGIKGTYVRPEDVKLYEQFVDSLEFIADNLTQEKTFLKIYQIDRTWPGNLRFLLKNFNYDVDNRAIPEEFGEARMYCRQNCMRKGTCDFCNTAVKFSRAMSDKRRRLLKQLKDDA